MSVFRHFVPGEPRAKGFPFEFDIQEISEEITPDITLVFEIDGKEDLIENLTLELQRVFEFYKYLDKNSPDFIGTTGVSPTYYARVDVVQTTQDLLTKKKEKNVVGTILIKCFNFRSEYTFNLITSIEQLNNTLDGANILTFDVETNGLDPEFGVVAGINFATIKDTKAGYYIPLAHAKPYDQFNLGQEAYDVFYEAMVRADKVYMYNARFDIRNAEYQEYEYDKTSHNITNIKYDMSKVKFIDTYITCYFADPDWKQSNMDFHEKHFLGFHRFDLKETLRQYDIKDFDTTQLDPRNLLFYGAQDGITTLNLGLRTEKYLPEFGLSGQIDMEIIYPLMKLENRLIRIDTEYVNQELAKLDKRLGELDELIMDSIGYDINLNSSVQKQQLFESFNLDTKVKTNGGAMSTSREAVDKMIERMDAAGESYPNFLKYLGEQSKLQILRSTFFYSLSKQMGYRDGRVRLNYRHGNTATGRFSSGKEQ